MDVIRDKRNPRKGENAEERNCLIVSVLVLQLRAVRLSLVTMERYKKQSNCDSILPQFPWKSALGVSGSFSFLRKTALEKQQYKPKSKKKEG